VKLVAIYNVWDGVELLRGSMECLKDHVDFFIIVHQDVSNFGEKYDPLPEINLEGVNYFLIKYTPERLGGANNERAKRNLGIEAAKTYGFTHFILMDTDEYYQDFGKAKELYIQSGASGSVCKLFTYFKEPTLRFETEDGYYVPFIHQLKPNTEAGRKEYPFYVDPTRRINEVNVAELPAHMHHFSWVRKDIERKARNSSAKANLERGTMLQDYHNPEVKEGFYVRDYDKKLIRVPNQFNILL
jgi:hypothetical protein